MDSDSQPKHITVEQPSCKTPTRPISDLRCPDAPRAAREARLFERCPSPVMPLAPRALNFDDVPEEEGEVVEEVEEGEIVEEVEEVDD